MKKTNVKHYCMKLFFVSFLLLTTGTLSACGEKKPKDIIKLEDIQNFISQYWPKLTIKTFEIIQSQTEEKKLHADLKLKGVDSYADFGLDGNITYLKYDQGWKYSEAYFELAEIDIPEISEDEFVGMLKNDSTLNTLAKTEGLDKEIIDLDSIIEVGKETNTFVNANNIERKYNNGIYAKWTKENEGKYLITRDTIMSHFKYGSKSEWERGFDEKETQTLLKKNVEGSYKASALLVDDIIPFTIENVNTEDNTLVINLSETKSVTLSNPTVGNGVITFSTDQYNEYTNGEYSAANMTFENKIKEVNLRIEKNMIILNIKGQWLEQTYYTNN